jgi:hypothetical protein
VTKTTVLADGWLPIPDSLLAALGWPDGTIVVLEVVADATAVIVSLAGAGDVVDNKEITES